MKYFLGIDIGTSGTKSLIMDAKGQVIATATAPHGISAPRPLWSEQDPGDWWRSSVKATQAVIKKSKIAGKQIAAIGLSGQMHGLVITDDAGKPLRPSIIWNDQRTAKQAADIEEAVGGRAKLIELVGNPAMTSFTLTKLLWVRDNEPRIYARIKHMLLPKDYVRLCLTGEYVGEVSDMSGTLMLDQRKRDWSDAIISKFQIDRSILPPVFESHEITGLVTAEVARLLGISAGTPVVGGGGDQAAGAVGNGVVEEGLTSATMGTSGVVFVHSHKYKTDPQGRINAFCSSVADEYCMFGCVLSAGGSLQWYRNVLAQVEMVAAAKAKAEPYDLIVAQAQEAPAGCEGVYWLPYLTGERTPHSDPLARACWIGINSRTTRAELARSVMEGATYAMNDIMTLLGDSGLSIKQIRLSGGGARSQFWRQLQADIYGKTCVTINAEEGPAYGAAILASVGEGTFKNVREACKAGIKVVRTIKPKAAGKRFYQAHYNQFRRLYPALKAEFAKIAELG